MATTGVLPFTPAGLVVRVDAFFFINASKSEIRGQSRTIGDSGVRPEFFLL